MLACWLCGFANNCMVGVVLAHCKQIYDRFYVSQFALSYSNHVYDGNFVSGGSVFGVKRAHGEQVYDWLC